MRFESLVNTEGFQTKRSCSSDDWVFESLVNTEGFQTQIQTDAQECEFESLVNTEGFQTIKRSYVIVACLRVLRRLSTTDSMSI